MTQPIDASYGDIQGNILNSFATRTAGYFFLTITDPGMFRRALGTVLSQRVTSEADLRGGGALDRVMQIGFTYNGLQRIGLSENDLAALPDAYAAGMAHRAATLGDLGTSAPINWSAPFGSGAIHVVVCVLSASSDGGDVDHAWQQLKDDGALDGTALLHDCRGASLMRRSGNVQFREEPFGFRDGISQPDIDLPGTTSPAGPAARIAPGEFILGYEDEIDRGLKRPAPSVPPLLQNGSYMVFRKIQQHVAELDTFIADARPPDDDKTRLKAELFGRWPNGAPLGPGPQPPTPTDAAANDLQFARSGDACPVWSHIRRANPRDGLGTQAEVRRHRIIRRGIRYAEPSGETGVLFVCFNARLDDQFEFIQANWLNSGNFAALPSNSVDPIAGSSADGSATYARPLGGTIAHLPVLTTVRGGEYFLVPGRAALALLAGAAPAPPVAALAAAAPPPSDDPFDFDTMGPRSLAEEAPSKELVWEDGHRENIYFIGQHDLVTKALNDDTHFEVTPYDRRITQVTGGARLLVGLSPVRDAAARTKRRTQLASLMPIGAAATPADAALVGAVAQAALAQTVTGPGAINVVDTVARTVPLAVVVNYLGIRPPATLSPIAFAAFFARAPGEVPPQWASAFPPLPEGPAGQGMYTLAFWTRMLFVQAFGNLADAPEIRDYAAAATQEFLAHLDQLLAAPPPPQPTTVLERAVATGIPADDARLLLLELAVGGTDTTATGIANVLDLLLSRPEAMQAARTAVRTGAGDADLDAVIQESLRLAPVAGMLSRRSTDQPATVGQTPIAPDSLVCVLTAAASNDPRVFPDGASFRTDRSPTLYRNFGAGAHACAGQWLALLQLRTVLRWILGPTESEGPARFPKLRRAAGPMGQKIDFGGIPLSLYLWLE